MLALLIGTLPSQELQLKDGLVIERSATVVAREYSIPNDAEDGHSAAITIRGDGIVVDFQGAILRGTPQTVQPDQRRGTAVFVEGSDITITNLNAHGYKIGLVARGVDGLKLVNCDFSYNWKQHLKSTLEKEDLSDWMSFHHNENDEWLRFGAGAYLRDCDNFVVNDLTVNGGQSGLMITECDNGTVKNSDFSFLSAIGLGMYRCNENRVMNNAIDWCVRGYSHGVYNRGQDSAGILVYEQSNRNTFAYNSVTHGGDGFFLWAGQTTMDTGEGGCNDNLLYGNDFSHAVTNGIEATFSRNQFINNLMLECWHGMWAGYSYESKVLHNTFGYNGEGIAWEHGQDNLIAGNSFQSGVVAINLWTKESEDPDWGYSKHRDTQGRDVLLTLNSVYGLQGPVVRIVDVRNVSIVTNWFTACGQIFELGGDNDGLQIGAPMVGATEKSKLPEIVQFAIWEIDSEYSVPAPTMQRSGIHVPGSDQDDYLARFDVGWDPLGFDGLFEGDAPVPPSDAVNPFISSGELRGRKYILVDEWGPYDFKSPLIWPRGIVAAASSTSIDAEGNQAPPFRTEVHQFEILGPPGKWRAVEVRGARLNKQSGDVPGFVEATIVASEPADVLIRMEYIGEEATDYRGIVTPAGTPVVFEYSQFFAPIDWAVNWFSWEGKTDPRESADAFNALLKTEPLASLRTSKLDIATGGSPHTGVPENHFATVATGEFQIEEGDYALEVTTDDGVRVWVDGELVIDSWKYQGPTAYTANLHLGGSHSIRVEHFEIDGYTALKVNLKRRE